jgi:hypothetical protein
VGLQLRDTFRPIEIGYLRSLVNYAHDQRITDLSPSCIIHQANQRRSLRERGVSVQSHAAYFFIQLEENVILWAMYTEQCINVRCLWTEEQSSKRQRGYI